MTHTGKEAQVLRSAEVEAAQQDGNAVVALESTIISHGMPYPDNVETALRVEQAIRDRGAVPATVAVLDGRLCVGLDEAQIEHLGKAGPAVTKLSRRDLPIAVAAGKDGATTVAATMIAAAAAGVRVFATGGIGGVHRDVAETLDISADLTELGRTSVAVVCAGVKSVLDIPRTLEHLETLGVPVIGYGTDEMPAFYTRSSGLPVDVRADDPADIAAIMHSKWQLGLDGGLVVANPVPEGDAMDPAVIDKVIEAALSDMASRGIRGKDTTPFLLERIANATGGESLATNIALVLNNARLAADTALAYQSLLQTTA